MPLAFGGVMHSVHGEPALMNCVLNAPLLSNTWIRRFSRSATYTFPWASVTIECGTLNWPGAVPCDPHDLTNLPFESWPEVLGSERLTGAMLDRLTHRVQILEANGESYRLRESKRRQRRGSPRDARGNREGG